MKYLECSPPVGPPAPAGAQRDGTYATVLGVLEVKPRGGFSVAEMYRRLGVMQAVKSAEQQELPVIELDDDQAACLEQCVADARWNNFTLEVIEFDHAVKAMMSGETRSEPALLESPPPLTPPEGSHT